MLSSEADDNENHTEIDRIIDIMKDIKNLSLNDSLNKVLADICDRMVGYHRRILDLEVEARKKDEEFVENVRNAIRNITNNN